MLQLFLSLPIKVRERHGALLRFLASFWEGTKVAGWGGGGISAGGVALGAVTPRSAAPGAAAAGCGLPAARRQHPCHPRAAGARPWVGSSPLLPASCIGAGGITRADGAGRGWEPLGRGAAGAKQPPWPGGRRAAEPRDEAGAGGAGGSAGERAGSGCAPAPHCQAGGCRQRGLGRLALRGRGRCARGGERRPWVARGTGGFGGAPGHVQAGFEEGGEDRAPPPLVG